MANYSITTTATVVSDLTTVTAALEVLLEAVVNTKTIRYIDIKQIGTDSFQGILMVDT